MEVLVTKTINIMKTSEKFFDLSLPIMFFISAFLLGWIAVFIGAYFSGGLNLEVFDWCHSHSELIKTNPFSFLSFIGIDEYTSTFLYYQNFTGLILSLIAGAVFFILLSALGVHVLIGNIRHVKEMDALNKENERLKNENELQRLHHKLTMHSINSATRLLEEGIERVLNNKEPRENH